MHEGFGTMNGTASQSRKLREVVRYEAPRMHGLVVQGDAIAFLQSLRTGSADLVFRVCADLSGSREQGEVNTMPI
jgi:hypothetical protein